METRLQDVVDYCEERQLEVEESELLFLLLRRVLRVVEAEWTHAIRLILNRSFDQQRWLDMAAEFLGAKARRHLRLQTASFDLYILLGLFTRFIGVLAKALFRSSLAESVEEFIERKDRLREAAARLGSFRIQAAHDMRSVSSREVMSAFLAMRFVTTSLLTAVEVSQSGSQTTDLEETMEAHANCRFTDVFPAVSAITELTESLRHVSVLCKTGHDMQARIEVNVGTHRGKEEMLALFAHQLLSILEIHLQESIRKLMGDEKYQETRQRLKACQLDIQAIGAFLLQALKNEKNIGPSEDSPFNEHQKSFLQTRAAREKFFTHVDRLAGPKRGLRNAIAHGDGSSGAITVLSLQNCAESAKSVISWLTGKECIPQLGEFSLRLNEVGAQWTRATGKGRKQALASPRQNRPSVERIWSITVRMCSIKPQPAKKHFFIRLPSPASGIVGRKDTINEIVGHISQRNASQTVLFGEGGIGKSSVAAEVAERLRQKCPFQFWLPSTTSSSLRSSLRNAMAVFSGCTESEQQHDSVVSVQTFLDQAKKSRTKLLLVFDDVFDAKPFVQKLTSTDAGHHIIITTLVRDEAYWSRALPSAKLVKLGPLEITACLEILTSKLQSHSPRFSVNGMLLSTNLQMWLEKRLHNIPLAVQLAGSVLAQVGFEKAVDLLRFGKETSLDELFCVHSEKSSLLNRGVSDSVEFLLSRISQEAKAILIMFSFLGGWVPWKALTNRLMCLRESQPEQVNYQDLWQCVGGTQNGQFLSELQLCGLITGGTQSAIVAGSHQLVQRAVLDKVCQTADRLTRIVHQGLYCLLRDACRTEWPHRHGAGTTIPRLLPNLFPMLENFLQLPRGLNDDDMSELATWLARGSYGLLADMEAACNWYRQAVELASRCDTLDCSLLAELGAVLWRKGCAAEGISVLQEAIKLAKENPSPCKASSSSLSISFTMLRGELASAYLREGRPFEQIGELLEADELPSTELRQLGNPQPDYVICGPLSAKVFYLNGKTSTTTDLQFQFWTGVELISNGNPDKGFAMAFEAVRSLLAIVSEPGCHGYEGLLLTFSWLLSVFSAMRSFEECLVCRQILLEAIHRHVAYLFTLERFTNANVVGTS